MTTTGSDDSSKNISYLDKSSRCDFPLCTSAAEIKFAEERHNEIKETLGEIKTGQLKMVSTITDISLDMKNISLLSLEIQHIKKNIIDLHFGLTKLKELHKEDIDKISAEKFTMAKELFYSAIGIIVSLMGAIAYHYFYVQH